jgi:hypothetical protein
MPLPFLLLYQISLICLSGITKRYSVFAKGLGNYRKLVNMMRVQISLTMTGISLFANNKVQESKLEQIKICWQVKFI